MPRPTLLLIPAAALLAACAGSDDPIAQNTANVPGSPESNCIQMAVEDTGYSAGDVQVTPGDAGGYDVAVVGARFFCTTGDDGSVTSFVPV